MKSMCWQQVHQSRVHAHLQGLVCVRESMLSWHVNFPSGVNVPQSNLLRGFFLTQQSHRQGTAG